MSTLMLNYFSTAPLTLCSYINQSMQTRPQINFPHLQTSFVTVLAQYTDVTGINTSTNKCVDILVGEIFHLKIRKGIHYYSTSITYKTKYTTIQHTKQLNHTTTLFRIIIYRHLKMEETGGSKQQR